MRMLFICCMILKLLSTPVHAAHVVAKYSHRAPSYGQRMMSVSTGNKFDWAVWKQGVNRQMAINFAANFKIYLKYLHSRDSFVLQLKKIGYDFDPNGTLKPSPFETVIEYYKREIQQLVDFGLVKQDEILMPAKVFKDRSRDKHYFVPLWEEVPEEAKDVPENLLTPDVFTTMLSEGYFPIGDEIIEHTNQSLAEHDAAHLLGFLDAPLYMKEVRKAFSRLGKMLNGEGITREEQLRMKQALKNFDSVLSLRLYYATEIFTSVKPENQKHVRALLALPKGDKSTLDDVKEFIYQKFNEQGEAELYRYLTRVYEKFPEYFSASGGESRDVVNRDRKYNSKGATKGGIYPSKLVSKFDNQSIWSMVQNAEDALKYIRSSHANFHDVINEVHVRVIAALNQINQLDQSDWIKVASSLYVDKNSETYRYLCTSGIWNKSHILFWAFCSDEFDKVIHDE